MKTLVFPKKFVEKVQSQIEENLEIKLVKVREDTSSRLDQSINSVISKTKSLIDAIPHYDDKELVSDISRISKRIALSEEKSNRDISTDLVKKVLSKIKIPSDGKKGIPGKKGKDAKPYILTEKDRLDITEPITREIFNKTVSEEKVLQIISDVIERLKNGKIRIKNTSGGANGSEIISKINTFLETTGWQLDVTVENPIRLLYIFGDDTTDGSVRLKLTEGDDIAHIEKLENSVWNDTGFRFSSSSVNLGRDFKLSAVGGFMETQNISEIDDHLKALVPHIQFDIDGTLGAAHMPVLDAREDFTVYEGPATGEIISTSIGQSFSATPTRILHSATHTVGSISATSEVEVSYYKGADNTGSLLHRSNLPASDFVASNELTIIYDSDFGFENATNIFFEFTSDTDFSLATNASGEIITEQNGHTLDELDIILDEFVLSNDLSLLFDNDLGFVVNNRF